MGSYGWSIPLAAIPSTKQATTKRVRSVLIEALAELWDELTPHPWGRRATDWITLGQDSLLRIGDPDADADVPTELTFWFYESAEWPRSLAEHWLRLALAAGRYEIEQALAKAGFAIPAESALSLVAELGPKRKGPRFFSAPKRVGVADAETVSWQLDDDGEYRLPPTPAAELDDATRETLARVLETGVCACPVCERLRDQSARALTPERGSLEPIFVGNWIQDVAATRRGSVVVAARAYRFHAWTARAADPAKGPWATIGVLSDRKRIVDFVHEVDDELVAVVGYSSAKPPRHASVSLDDGATWSDPAPCGLPPIDDPRFFGTPYLPKVLFARARVKPPLYRSDDGGVTFRLVSESPTWIGAAGKKQARTEAPLREIYGLAPARDGGARLVALAAPKVPKAVATIAVSEDGGQTFHDAPIPELAAHWLLGTPAGQLVVFGVRDGARAIARSSDDGRTWTIAGTLPGPPGTIHLGRRLWWIGTSGDDAALFVSEDEGATWTRAIASPVTRVYALPDSDDVLVAARGALFRYAP